MKPTLRCLEALELGSSMGLMETFDAAYAERLAETQALIDGLDIDLRLPPTYHEFNADNDWIDKLSAHFAQERSMLGSDPYCLPLFLLGYLPLTLVLMAADRHDQYEDYLGVFKGVLRDLDIESESASLREHIDLEVQWLRPEAGGGGRFESQGAVLAANRLLARVHRLWELGMANFELRPRFSFPPFQSVFISYSTKDQAFVDLLYRELRRSGVRVWLATQEMSPGKTVDSQLREGIGRNDRLLLVLSDASLRSAWVEAEILHAVQREREERTNVLFPIRLTSLKVIDEWRPSKTAAGIDLGAEIRKYDIQDLTAWRDADAFEKELNRLLAALVAAETRDRVERRAEVSDLLRRTTGYS